MIEELRAKAVIEIEGHFKSALFEVVKKMTDDEDEREQIAGAVLGLMLRNMYRVRGQEWLERVLRHVLQPIEQVRDGDSPPT